MVAITPRLESKSIPLVSTAGMELGYWGVISNGDLELPGFLAGITYGITTSFLAKKIRTSVTTVPEFVRASRHARLIWTIGVNDVSGIAYWGARLRQH